MDKVICTLTLDDCRDYVKYQLKIKRIRKFILKMYIPFWIIGLIFFIVNLLPVFSVKDVPYTDAWNVFLFYLEYALSLVLPIVIIWCLIFAFVISLYFFDPFHCVSKRVYKMLQGGSLEAEIEVKDDGIYAVSKSASSVMNWNGIIDIYDTGKTFLIFISDYRAMLVPKRAFQDERKAQEFFDLVNERLANSRSNQ